MLRSERDIPRVQAHLTFRGSRRTAGTLDLRAALIAGVTAAFIAGLWGKGWIWAAIVLLVVMFAAMYARAPTWFPRPTPRGRSALRDGEGRLDELSPDMSHK